MEKLQTPHGIFTSNTVTGQSAQEVYNEWLASKDAPPRPSDDETLNAKIELKMLDLLIELGVI